MLTRREVLNLSGFSLLGLLSGCARSVIPTQIKLNNFRTGNRTLRLAIWGDVRPSCSTGYWDPVTPKIFERLAILDKEKPFDLVITTGDYICAWPWEGELALRQLDGVPKKEYTEAKTKFDAAVEAGSMTPQDCGKELLKLNGLLHMYPRNLFSRTIFAPGNHEVGHMQLFRTANMYMLPFGYYDLEDLRVVVLPSEMDLTAMSQLTPEWIRNATDHTGRLIVVRHEPSLSCGTWNKWIMDTAQSANPNLVFYGHRHDWLAPNSFYTECDRKLQLKRNEFICGNGGASGWKEQAGWAGVTVVTLYPDGHADAQGIDVEGKSQKFVTVAAPQVK